MSIESKAEATHDQSPSPQAPWLGLRSYDEAARGYFYGREREVQELYQSVCEHRLSVLFGRSGLGKTSLLRAGLLPRLRAEGRRGVLIRLRFDDEAAPLVQQVREALHAVLRPELEPETERAADLQERPLWQLAHQAQTRSALEFLRPVLIFDQFEEVFSLGAGSDDEKRKRRDRRSEVETLLFELADLIEDREPASLRERLRSERDFAAEFIPGEHPLRVLITLREDYLHQLERWRRTLPSLMRQRIELLALRGPEALDVVLKPARKRALPLLETDVAERIVRIAAKAKAETPIDWIEAVPPLLSQLCFELNGIRLQRGGDSDTSQIEASDVQQDAANVLKHYYQRCLHGRPKGVAQAIEFLLIDDGGRIREASSQDTVLSQMRGYGVEQPEHELEQLIELRLLTREERGGAPRIELTHDSLVEVVADARNAREAEERAEAERVEAERLRKTKQSQQRQKQTNVFASLLLLLTFFLTVAVWQSLTQRDRARTAETQARELLKQAAERALGRAHEQFALNEPFDAAAYLAESLRFDKALAPNDAAIAVQQRTAPGLKSVLEHKGTVNSAAFSPDGTRVVTASRNTARIWDAQSGQAIGAPLKHEDGVNSAVFSPDSTRVVTGSRDNTARIWDTHSGQAIGAPLKHEGTVISARSRSVTPVFTASGVVFVAFSPDSTRVVTASVDSTARIWDAQSGQAIGAPLKHKNRVYSAAFSPDSARVVTASADGTARIWDAQSGQAIGAPLKHGGTVIYAAFSPDGTRLATASADRTARIWDAQSGQALGAPLQHEGPVTTAVFSPDGTRLVTASADRTARIWDAQSGQSIGAPLKHENGVNSAAFGPDGTRVVTASRDNTARIWDAQSGQAIGAPLRHEDWVVSAAFSPDSTRVLTASEDGTACIWDAQNGRATGASFKHEKEVASAAFSPNGTRVVTANGDTARIWDAQSGQSIGAPLKHEDGVNSAAFSPDGTRVVTGSWDNTARIWDARSGQAIGAPLKHDGIATFASYRPDGTPEFSASGVVFVAFSPDSTRVVTASVDSTARIWDAQSGQAIGAPLKHKNGVNSAAFSPDGTRVVTASADGTARIWDVQSGQAFGAPLKHEKDVYSAAFSPDGTRVVTANGDTARIWDAQSGQALGAPLKHEDLVASAAFSPDGTRVVTASRDHTARIWDAQTAEMLGATIAPDDLMALSGRRVADNGQLEWLSGPEWMAVINIVKAQAEQGTTKKDQLMRWHFSDLATRTISPFSQITVPQHIEREIDWVLEHPQTEDPEGPNYSPKILDDAYNLDPSHPLILLALSVFEDRPQTKALWKRLSFPRFEKDARLAARAAEILLIDKDPENARKAAEMALNLATATDADKAKAQAVLDTVSSSNP